MKHLKLLPFLIAAAFAGPRAHAAEQGATQHETSNYAAGAICFGLLVLTARRSRVEAFKH